MNRFHSPDPTQNYGRGRALYASTPGPSDFMAKQQMAEKANQQNPHALTAYKTGAQGRLGADLGDLPNTGAGFVDERGVRVQAETPVFKPGKAANQQIDSQKFDPAKMPADAQMPVSSFAACLSASPRKEDPRACSPG